MKHLFIICVVSIFFYSPNTYAQLMQKNEADSLAKMQAKPKNSNLLNFNLGEAKLSFNAYADFGYVVGPQRTHTFYDYITRDTVTQFGRRDFTSYPLYANQFSLSYAYIQAQYEIENKLRFRIAFHTGHIVDALYIEETPSTRIIRELALYYHLNKKWAIEVGIFPSYFGFEIVLNKENLHATRAYIADYTPDYEAGARLHYFINKYNTLRFMVLNGWQEIKEENGKKALAFVWSINKPNKIVGDWNVYLGNEYDNLKNQSKIRHYHNAYYKIWVGRKWIVAPVIDYVMEQKPINGTGSERGWNFVVAPAFSLRYAVTPKHGIAARWDYVYNPMDIIPELKTNTANGWQSNAFTLTLEYLPLPQLTFRVESKYGINKDAVFRGRYNEPTREDWYGLASFSFHF
ncbi:MAG: hypothetical protein EAZ08_00310 [Cytophagales bacterium]|nr:MAG: hypothetical protein EAZ08_00310 [Cytophagales bacterium]